MGFPAGFFHMFPGIEIIGIQLHGLSEMRQSLFIFALFFAQIAEKVMDLWLLGIAFGQRGKNLVRDALRLLAFESAFATETVALHTAETVGHQFISTPKMLCCLIVFS